MVARLAHNQQVVGSNPSPATKTKPMEKNNSNTIITRISQKGAEVIIDAITLSQNRPDHKYVIEPSDMVPEKHWGTLMDNNRFQFVISLV